MSTKNTAICEWEEKRTDETRDVEKRLRQHFEKADAYRYNSASIRVRVVDSKFKGLSNEARDDLVEPVLDLLPKDTQADIMSLVLLYPGEEQESFRAQIHNLEFEHPSQSIL